MRFRRRNPPRLGNSRCGLVDCLCDRPIDLLFHGAVLLKRTRRNRPPAYSAGVDATVICGGNGRYPLRVRTVMFLKRAPAKRTEISRQPRLGLGSG